jgi:hypothetical protein
MEAIRSSETLVHTGSIRRHIPEDGILQDSSSFEVRIAIYKSKIYIHIIRKVCHKSVRNKNEAILVRGRGGP